MLITYWPINIVFMSRHRSR